jgi:adenylosuccinate lyase
MAATEKMKNGEPFDLLAELAGEPSFGMSKEEMETLLSPEKYTGRCSKQVESFIESVKGRYENAEDIPDGIEL